MKNLSFEDHFSQQAQEYARYRPSYPSALFAYLASITPGHELAWDCGTGNGQAALALVQYFDHVVATDASPDQLSQAPLHQQIEYRVEQAEHVSLESGSVDLVTVAVAVHWFDLQLFYQEVQRVLKPGGIVAVWTYHLPMINPDIDRVINNYYAQVLAGYWPGRFRYADERYQTLPFPFQELQPVEFTMQAEWNLNHLLGFLDSWSATRKYMVEHRHHPLKRIWKELATAWGEENQTRMIRWPLHTRIGSVNEDS
jgi:SAM-dependent methyltransferase